MYVTIRKYSGCGDMKEVNRVALASWNAGRASDGEVAGAGAAAAVGLSVKYSFSSLPGLK